MTFRNITTYGTSSRKNERGNVFIKGLDEKHDVSNVTFDNVWYYDKKID